MGGSPTPSRSGRPRTRARSLPVANCTQPAIRDGLHRRGGPSGPNALTDLLLTPEMGQTSKDDCPGRSSAAICSCRPTQRRFPRTSRTSSDAPVVRRCVHGETPAAPPPAQRRETAPTLHALCFVQLVAPHPLSPLTDCRSRIRCWGSTHRRESDCVPVGEAYPVGALRLDEAVAELFLVEPGVDPIDGQ
jgi:hypothetical protein